MIRKTAILSVLVLVGLLLLSVTLLPKSESESYSKATPQISLLTNTKQFTAGDSITLQFKGVKTEGITLLLKSSYATLLVEPKVKGDTLSFTTPEFFNKKTGQVNWSLIVNQQTVQKGIFEIIPQQETSRIENYLGPRSTPVGDGHYTMMVAIPEDKYGNPMPDSTATTISNQFLDRISNYNLPTEHFISWKRLYSPKKSGKMLTSVTCQNAETKETETDIFPAPPTKFTISYTRNHTFADGNQLTTFRTSILRDKFKNVVSDGTMVYFILTTEKGIKLKSFGATVNGVAEAKFPAPEHKATYTVKAYVTGMAESKAISIDYKAVPAVIPYHYDTGKRILTVGEITSFMGQIAPEGTTVTANFYVADKHIATLTKYTEKGIVTFKLPKGEYPEKQYKVTISAFGKTIEGEIKPNEAVKKKQVKPNE